MDAPPRDEQQSGDLPSARFGHTSTFVGNHKVVLFGGAVGDLGRHVITADVYICDLLFFRWVKCACEKNPQPRAAHAAACVDEMQLVVYGGASGGGALSSDELYLLDLRKMPNPAWIVIPTTGLSPGRRYGHTMVYSHPNLIVFGGNDGQRALADLWHVNLESFPFSWKTIPLRSNLEHPLPRVYHSAEICKEGPAATMMVVFGGRGSDSRSLNDTWGLLQHRDGQWDWKEAPIKKGNPPDARFQHTSIFIGSKLVVIGGRGENDCNKELPTLVYDTESSEWRFLHSIGRFRHSSWANETTIYVFGGFTHQGQQQAVADMKTMDCSVQTEFYNEREIDKLKRKSAKQSRFAIDATDRDYLNSIVQSSTGVTSTQRGLKEAPVIVGKVNQQAPTSASTQGGGRPTNVPASREKPTGSYAAARASPIRLSSHAHAAQDAKFDFSALIKKISIDKLEEEGKKINKLMLSGGKFQDHKAEIPTLNDKIIGLLMNPSLTFAECHNMFNQHTRFCVPTADICVLLDEILNVFKSEEVVMDLRTPIKVYGDIHGQYYDLMRMFRLYKAPVDEDAADEMNVVGDLDSNDYLFLGDFVDRGANSLEVICLLFALKCKYPKRIHLIRGNHEDIDINCMYGFQDECKRRLREDTEAAGSCWKKFNEVFEWLPMAALIEGEILCIHGGIGGSINSVDDIRGMHRPIKVLQVPKNIYEQRVTDLLWSDPTENDSCLGVVPNEVRDPEGLGHIVKFGPDRVFEFLEGNSLQLIIRAHECVMDGFERFAKGKLITLFSATKYCNYYQNAGALLFIRRDMTILPKLIFPISDNESQPHSFWDSKMTQLRPPTPPRNKSIMQYQGMLPHSRR